MTRGLAPLSGATLTAALLAACAHLPVGDDGLSYEQRRTRLEAVGAWEMRGRLAVQTGDDAFQGRFSWQQRADALDLAVRSPLGAGVLEVNGTPSALKVTARGDTRVLEDPETQLSELLGWWLPVGSLHAWLLGLPDPTFKASTELRTTARSPRSSSGSGESRSRAISSRPRRPAPSRGCSSRGASSSRTARSTCVSRSTTGTLRPRPERRAERRATMKAGV